MRVKSKVKGLFSIGVSALSLLLCTAGGERACGLSRGEGGEQISTAREGETGLQAIARLQRESLGQQALQGMEIAFRRTLQRDVEHTRDLVRTGMAFASLMAGARANQINILDDTAYRATQENFFAQVIGAGLAIWETVRIVGEAVDVYRQEGLGAALAHAGKEVATEVALAVTGIKAVKVVGKVASKVFKWGKRTQAFAWACEKVGAHTPEAAKALWGQVGGIFQHGAQALGRLDRRLDQWALGQFQSLGFVMPNNSLSCLWPTFRGAPQHRPITGRMRAPASFNQIESFSVKTAFDGALYPKEKLSSLVNYLERRGVYVFGTQGDPYFLGKWNGTGQIYWPENPTVLQVKHELSHYLDFKKLGVHEYVKLPRYEREALVLERLQKNRIWSDLNDLEKEFSINYVKRLKLKFYKEGINNE